VARPQGKLTKFLNAKLGLPDYPRDTEYPNLILRDLIMVVDFNLRAMAHPTQQNNNYYRLGGK